MKILVTGALGQLGSELIPSLGERYGFDSILATDVREGNLKGVRMVKMDVTSLDSLKKLIRDEGIEEVFHLAAILSANGEKNPDLAYSVNMNGTWNILAASRDNDVKKVIIPSTIGVFGPDTPKKMVPPETIIRPRTMYGITKLASEFLGQYFSDRFGLDCRGLRFPGLISYSSPPGGGTTDYSIEMIMAAARGQSYQCFLKEDSRLPMMYMPDAISSLISLSEADPKSLKRRMDYHVSAFSFTPGELYAELRKRRPEFTVTFKPDYRQEIADQWPESLDVSESARDWGFSPAYGFSSMIDDMLKHIS